MAKSIYLILIILIMASCKPQQKIIISQAAVVRCTAPTALPGNFIDDYNIHYSINDTLWFQQPSLRYHILKWDTAVQYLIAQNDTANPGDKNLFTRIDYMPFTGMEPYRWGFCLTVYNAKSDSLADAAASADRLHPRKGCNGFPFSRMKKAE